MKQGSIFSVTLVLIRHLVATNRNALTRRAQSKNKEKKEKTSGKKREKKTSGSKMIFID